MEARSQLVGVLLIVAVSGTVVGAVGGTVTGAWDRPASEAWNESGAGAAVAGGIAIEHGAVSGAVERARFERDLRAADTHDARAAVLARYLHRTRERLVALERRAGDLDAALANGSLDPGGYDVRVASLGGRAAAIHRLAGAMANASEGLPADTRREHDVEPSRIRRLGAEAGDLAERLPGDTGRVNGAIYGDVARMIRTYNEAVGRTHTDRLDRFLADRLRGERVNFRVGAAGVSSVTVSFRVGRGGRLTEVRAGPRGDATLRIDTDRRTVRRIASADDAFAAFHRAVGADEIRLAGIGPVNALEWRLVDTGASLLDRR